MKRFGLCFKQNELSLFDLCAKKYDHPKSRKYFANARKYFGQYGCSPWVEIVLTDAGSIYDCNWNPTWYEGDNTTQIIFSEDGWEGWMDELDSLLGSKLTPRRIPLNPIRCEPLPLPE